MVIFFRGLGQYRGRVLRRRLLTSHLHYFWTEGTEFGSVETCQWGRGPWDTLDDFGNSVDVTPDLGGRRVKIEEVRGCLQLGFPKSYF